MLILRIPCNNLELVSSAANILPDKACTDVGSHPFLRLALRDKGQLRHTNAVMHTHALASKMGNSPCAAIVFLGQSKQHLSADASDITSAVWPAWRFFGDGVTERTVNI